MVKAHEKLGGSKSFALNPYKGARAFVTHKVWVGNRLPQKPPTDYDADQPEPALGTVIPL